MSQKTSKEATIPEKFYTGHTLFGIGIILRLALVIYSEWQDYHFNIKYTDIDYSVYTDGAFEVLQGNSPYDRHTYRYTPLLAYMIIPNNLWPGFGKALFVISDIACSFYIKKILNLTTNLSKVTIDQLTATWVFNPIIFNVSSRGNADTLISLMVLVVLYNLAKGNIITAAIMYGTAAHFKIYPLIYALPMYFYIDADLKPWRLFTKKRLQFALISASIFIGLFFVFYAIYGWEFAYEGYFYHLIRKDNRHNFSVYFYYIYLNFTGVSPLQSILTFVPQITLLFVAGVKYYRDLPFCCFVQTFIFVMFNKVMTAQYFVWYMAFVPLFLYQNNLYRNHKGKFLLLWLAWLATELTWNFGAHLVEGQGKNAFTFIWIMCILFFLANCILICFTIKNQTITVFKAITNKAKSS